MIQMRRNARSLGIDVEYQAHAMAWLLPRKLFSQVPEWFREDEHGSRQADFNLCASNEDALAYVAERTALLARMLETGTNRYYFWLDDVPGCECHCARCRALNASDQQLKIVNAMLDGLRTVKPDAKLCFLAYHDTMVLPAKIQPKDGVFLEYAPFKRDHHRALNDPSCEMNAKEIENLAALVDFFGKKDSVALDYWMDNSKFSNWTKPPKPFTLDEETLKADVRLYDELGFETVTCFGCYLGPDYRALHGEAPIGRYGECIAEALKNN